MVPGPRGFPSTGARFKKEYMMEISSVTKKLCARHVRHERVNSGFWFTSRGFLSAGARLREKTGWLSQRIPTRSGHQSLRFRIFKRRFECLASLVPVAITCTPIVSLMTQISGIVDCTGHAFEVLGDKVAKLVVMVGGGGVRETEQEIESQ